MRDHLSFTSSRRRARRTLELPAEGGRVAVVADTHSRPHPNSFELLRAEAPDLMLHAGDIGDLVVLDALAGLAPLVPVRGNIDGHADSLPDDIDLTLRLGEAALQIHLTHIAVRGPRLRADARRRAQAARAQIVVCGHSHVPLIARDAGIAVFNPGSIGPRRFDLPITFGVIDIGAAGVSFRHVDCETGEAWTPG